MVTKTSPGECLVPEKIKFHALAQISQHFDISGKQIKIKNVDIPREKINRKNKRVKFSQKVGVLTRQICLNSSLTIKRRTKAQKEPVC